MTEYNCNNQDADTLKILLGGVIEKNERLNAENQKLKKLLRQVAEFAGLQDDAPCFDDCSSFQAYEGRCCPGPDILDALKEEV